MIKCKRLLGYISFTALTLLAIACSKKEKEQPLTDRVEAHKSLYSQVVTYQLDITADDVAIDDTTVKRYLVNGSSPAPTITANYGDQLDITVTNHTNQPTLLHWHGLFVPNDQDGVASVTTPIIDPNTSFTYRFPVKQLGTYWYHAHGLEEADGIYGGIVFTQHEENRVIEDAPVIIFSGELSQEASVVLNTLQHGTASAMAHDHGALEKVKATHPSHDPHPSDMKNHYADISYRYLLINGEREHYVLPKKYEVAGNVHLRLVNAYVDGYINLVYSGGEITILASDGIPVEPVKVDHLRMAMGESYDVMLSVNPQEESQLVAFFMGEEHRYSTLFLGSGDSMPLNSYDVRDYPTDQPYKQLRSLPVPWMQEPVIEESQVKTLAWELRGDHDTYHWSIEEDHTPINQMAVKAGDTIRLTLTNDTMMPHPMHLHGGYFRVINNDESLIKHTINIDPMEQVTIEFTLNDVGKWLFHCHNLFHMSSGMMMHFDVT